MKLLIILNELSLRGKWTELTIGLKFLNRIITRNYIDSYWKYTFQIVYRKLPQSIETIPQFIDCLQEMNIRKQNEIVYSFVYLLLSKNLFQLGSDLLQMYHLTAKYESEENINTLINSLNADIQFVKWKQSLKDDRNDFHEQLAERSINQLNAIVHNLDTTDCQISKLAQIYLHYEKIDDLEFLLENYAHQHPDYLNAQKYLFNFNLNQKNIYSLDIFHNVAKLSPSDSFILKHCRKFNDACMSIDCIFDMLDHFQWKYSLECWQCLYELLTLSEKDRSLKECISENWSIRQAYWTPYHFKRLNTNKSFELVNLVKLEICIMLLGYDHIFVNRIVEFYGLRIDSYKHISELRAWLVEI